MTHYLQVEMVNRFGELARIVNLISNRGFNIEKLLIDKTEKPDISRAKVFLAGDQSKIETLVKQINRQVRVTEARLLNETEARDDKFFNTEMTQN